MYESCATIEDCDLIIESLKNLLAKADDNDKPDIINALKTLTSQLKQKQEQQKQQQLEQQKQQQLEQQKHFNNIMNHIIDKGQYACDKDMTQSITNSILRKITPGRKKIAPCKTIAPDSDILLCRFAHDETIHKAMSNANFNTYIKTLFDLHFDNWVNTLDEKKKECVNENKNIRHMYEGAMISVFFFSYNNNDEDLLTDYNALFPLSLADSLGMTFQTTKTGGKTSRKKSTRKRKQRKAKKSRSKKI